MASQEFNRVLQSTIAEYMLGAEDLTIRNRKFLALLKSKGRITFNHSGTELNWGIRYKMRQFAGYADGDTIAFARSDTFKRANLPWRGYTLNDLVTKKEKLMNRGKPALIKYVSELVENMMEDFTQQFHRQLYIDGNARATRSSSTASIRSAQRTTTIAGNFIATPNNTYACLSPRTQGHMEVVGQVHGPLGSGTRSMTSGHQLSSIIRTQVGQRQLRRGRIRAMMRFAMASSSARGTIRSRE